MNNIQTPEIEPFSNDRLHRKAAAVFLTEFLIGRHKVSHSVEENASFVLNLNAEWGLGKTYFLTEWAKMLRARGLPVVYFDAWANDYAPNPFVGFMVQIQKELTTNLNASTRVRNKVRAMVKCAKAVAKAGAPTVAISLVKHFSGLEADKVLQTVKDASGEVFDELKRDLFKETETLQSTIEAFKDSLREVAQAISKSENHELPIFLLIDELDRCRPTYAIELLEKIKHVFRVKNIYTVVATDSTQLSHSIKAIYGEGFDSEKYLRRFFDHVSRLETPNFEDIAQFMLERRDLARANAFENPLSPLITENAHSKVLSLMAKALKLSIRDFERVIDIIDSIRLTYKQALDILFIGFFAMIYVSHSKAYAKFKERRAFGEFQKELMGHADFDIRLPYEQGFDVNSFHRNRESDMRWMEFISNYIEIVFNDDMQKLAASNDNITLRNLELELRKDPARLKSRRDCIDLVAMAGSFSV